MFCSYKNIFGEPNKGIHKYRIFGMAFFDIVGLLILTVIISKQYSFDFTHLLVCLILLTILIHYLFCVPTALNVAIGIAD